MKKVAITLFGISVFAGLGYLAFAHTPIGKSSLTGWLLKKWKEAAAKKKKPLDAEKLRKELKKLKYHELELLTAYTWLFPVLPGEDVEQKTKDKLIKRYKKLSDAGIFKKADLSALDNIVLPG